MARTHLALADPAGAWTVVRDAREIQRHRPYLAVLSEQLNRMEAQLHTTRANPIAGTTSLSTAELRVLAFLPTHLTFRESPNDCMCRRTPSSRRPCPSIGSLARPVRPTRYIELRSAAC
jgi:hypothetical protein